MTELTTKAGRALLDRQAGHVRHGTRGLFTVIPRDILAIEAEALADAARRVEGVLPPTEGTIFTVDGHERPARTHADFVDLFRAAVLRILTTPKEADHE